MFYSKAKIREGNLVSLKDHVDFQSSYFQCLESFSFLKFQLMALVICCDPDSKKLLIPNSSVLGLIQIMYTVC